MKRLRALKIENFGHYIDFVQRDKSGVELSWMIDVLTTHKTQFFREPEHFAFVKKFLSSSPPHSLRIWSAGCSSGEEPYSIAITIRESLSDTDLRDVKILATDISKTVLKKARRAVYPKEVVGDVQPLRMQKYFSCVHHKEPRLYEVNACVKKMVHFAQLNLMAAWPMNGPFDVIFCRNVMIYFDKSTQARLIHRFWEMLKPGGYFFAGHSESLSVISHPFRYVQPAVYVKE